VTSSTKPAKLRARVAELEEESRRRIEERNALIAGANAHTTACFAERKSLRARVAELEAELRTVLDATQSDQDVSVAIATRELTARQAGYQEAREQAAVIAQPYYLADKIRAMQPADANKAM